MSRTLPAWRQPVFWAALSFGAGILLGSCAWRPATWWVVAAAVFATASGFFLSRRPIFAELLALASVFWIGALSIQLQSAAVPSNQLAPFCNRSKISITAHLRRDGTIRQGSYGKPQQSLDLETESLTDEQGRWTAVTAGLRCTVFYSTDDEDDTDEAGHPRAFRYGERIRFSGKLHLPHNYGNPGAMDTRGYLLRQGIFALGSTRAGEIEMLPGSAGSAWGHLIATVRRSILVQMNELWGHDGPMIGAMLIGEKSLVDRETKQNFQRTGTFHILVVSGMNVGLMAFPVIWLLRRLRFGEAATTLITFVVTAIFACVADLGAPVLRATFMLWIYLIARLLYRHSRAPLNSLGISGLVLLAIDPQALFDASFQITFLCVLAIGGIAMPLLERTSAPYRRALAHVDSADVDVHLEPRLAQVRLDLRLLAERLARFWPGQKGEKVATWVLARAGLLLLGAFDVLLISGLMQFTMIPPMAAYFHRAAFLTVPSNSIVVPLTAVLTPVALGAVLLNYISPWLAWAPAVAGGILLHAITASVRLLGGVRVVDLRIPTPGVAALAATAVALALAMALVRRRRILMIAGLLAMVAASAYLVLCPCTRQVRFGALEVTAIDVGQGDSLLVVSPQGRALLVDAGGLSGQPRSNFDLGEDVVSPYLWSRGLSRLDAVAVTHGHSDHIGGMTSVMANFRPRELWISIVPSDPEFAILLQQAQSLGIEVKQFREGAGFDFGGAQVEVLAPPRDWESGKRARNNDALVLKLAYAGQSALLEGDAEKRIERFLVSGGHADAALLKVAHHGSATSATPDFLAAVQPRYAVISAGWQNQFSYPRREVLERLQAANVTTFRTDLHGAVSFYLDGRGIEVKLPNRR